MAPILNDSLRFFFNKSKKIGVNLPNRRHLRFVSILIGLVASVFLLDRLFPLKTTVPYSPVVLAADSTMLHAFLSRDDKWRLYTELREITPDLRQAILQKEDRYFYYHPGINPVALVRAVFRNITTGRRTSGASTITMQTVRLLEPRPRSYASKAIEFVRALQLEAHLSKDEILQLYLNLIPCGGNIEGLKSASWLYFGKPPTLLSLAEITTLTIIPNRPSSLRLGQNNAYIVQERNRFLERYRQRNAFSNATIDDALAEPLTARRRTAPTLAPHASRRLRAENPDAPVIYSTLKPTVQAAAEQLVTNYVNRVRAIGIQNAAVVVVDNQTLTILAYVGSANFSDVQDGGQVDGVQAVRSPGSALKPLLYGLAFDAGLITPKSRLNDVPINFGGYEPENYDRQFNGPVSAEFALANSLNIPAVKLLHDIGPSAMVSALEEAGFTTVKKQRKALGLSLVLGGCGVTLDEMTRLYAGFANGGKVGALNLTQKLDYQSGQQSTTLLLSPEATFMVTNTLRQLVRPDLPNNFDNSYHLPRIAWKTGTSYGRRDAWSIGYNQRFTIGVWIGNFSGVGIPALSGANTATPLLFQLFNTLDYNAPNGWFRPPAGLAKRQICPESGSVPGEFCTGRAVDYQIMGVSAARRCQHRKVVFTNAAGTLSYCPNCLPDGIGLVAKPGKEQKTVRRTYSNLAPELIAYYEAQHIPYEKIPPHNPACEQIPATGGPLIVSPNNSSEYFVDARQPAALPLTCQADNDTKTVYWYLNDRLYRKAKPAEDVFVTLRPGRYKISCADDRGRSSDIMIVVKSE